MFNCECLDTTFSEHAVANDDEWRSLNKFRDLFNINGIIVNKGCPNADYEPEDVHAETLHMLLVERK